MACLSLSSDAHAMFDDHPDDGRHTTIYCEAFLTGTLSNRARKSIRERVFERPFTVQSVGVEPLEIEWQKKLGLKKFNESDIRKLILHVEIQKDSPEGEVVARIGLIKGSTFQPVLRVPFASDDPSRWAPLQIYDHELNYSYSTIVDLYGDKLWRELRSGLGFGYHSDPDKDGVRKFIWLFHERTSFDSNLIVSFGLDIPYDPNREVSPDDINIIQTPVGKYHRVRLMEFMASDPGESDLPSFKFGFPKDG